MLTNPQGNIHNAGAIIIDKEESKAVRKQTNICRSTAILSNLFLFQVLNQRLQAEYSDSNSAIDVRQLLVCGIVGGLCGMLLAILLYATNHDGSCCYSMIMSLWFYFTKFF